MKRILVLLAFLSVTFFYSGNLFASPIFNAATGHWYEEVLANGDWYQAESYAVARGGHLVTINNAAENDWIVQNFDSFNDYHSSWIGFTDVVQEGNWVWISGEPVTYTNWYSGEPNNTNGNEDWGYMYVNHVDPSPVGTWNDIANHTVRVSHGIAEYNTNPVPEPSSLLLMGFGGIITAFIKRRRKT